MDRSATRLIAAICLTAPLLAAHARAEEQAGRLTLVDADGVTIRGGIVAGVQAVGQNNAFWKLSETFAPDENYNASPVWGEAYVKPFLTLRAGDGDTYAYGTLSVVASANVGTDVFDVTGPSAIALEDAVVGIRNSILDVSVGAQPYRLGTGMLLADGGGDGFERGALIFGPRLAWEMTAIGRLTLGGTRAEAFYLDPRELASGDTVTRIGGAALTHEFEPGRSFGIAVAEVLDSKALWVRAAPGGDGSPIFIPNGREGMRFVSGWGTFAVNDRLTLGGDVAVEWKDADDMTAWAARVQVSYAFPGLPFQPQLGYTYQTFSGDDPDTAELERFDPLFYDGSPPAWASGANASLVFLNTNISAHQLWASMTITPRDLFTVRLYHVTANELLSPLQFGQATRLRPGDSPGLIAGVTDPHLSDDIYFEYTRVISASAYLTAGLGISLPGKGIEEQRGGAYDVWTGGFLNLVVQF